MEVVQAWNWNEELNTFLIPIRFKNPITLVTKIKWCIFDTGFSGYFGLDEETIHLLGLQSIGKAKARTVSGIQEFENFIGNAEIIDGKQQSLAIFHLTSENLEVLIPIQNFQVPLIGMKSINQFSWLILTKNHTLCLIL